MSAEYPVLASLRFSLVWDSGVVTPDWGAGDIGDLGGDGGSSRVRRCQIPADNGDRDDDRRDDSLHDVIPSKYVKAYNPC